MCHRSSAGGVDSGGTAPRDRADGLPIRGIQHGDALGRIEPLAVDEGAGAEHVECLHWPYPVIEA
jgi:hypothetical protein